LADSDYVELTLPTRLSPEQRQRMIQAHSRLLATLNGPASKSAKDAARKAMRELRKQITTLGGRIDVKMSNYQTDPTTGEITGIIGNPQPGPAAKPRAIESAKGHQVRVPLYIEKPASKQQVLEAFPESALKPGEARTAPAAPAAPPGTASREGLFVPSAQRVDEATGQPITTPVAPTAPPTTPVVQAPAAATAAPAVPAPVEDLNADPLLGALPPVSGPAPAQQPAAAAETPEMTMLRRLVAEPEPPPPDTGLTIGQKAAYGFLVGLKPEAAAGVGQIISGQRAEAAQKYVLSRQNREALINNLTRIVQLQGIEAERAALRQDKQAALTEQAQASANKINELHASTAYTLSGVFPVIDALARNPDPALQARATALVSQMAEVKGVQGVMQSAFDRAPLSVDQNQIDLWDQRVKMLHANTLDALSELAKKIEQTKLPDTITSQIASLHNSSAALRQAIAMVKEGVGGPLSGRVLHTTIGALFAPGAAQQVGALDSLIEQASAERARGVTGRLAEFETIVFPSVFLSSTLTLEQFLGRAQGMIGYSEAKAKMLAGAPGAQTEAERSLAEAAGWVVVGHTPEGYPRWQSPQGIQYDEVPEVAP